jgi:hypothetical protein
MEISSFVRGVRSVGNRSVLLLLFSALLVLAPLLRATRGGQIFGASLPAKQVAQTPGSGQNVISLVSRNREGTDSGDNESRKTAMSADGRFIVFTSSATNLVGNGFTDTNNAPDVFVYDRLNDFTNCISTRNSSNFAANGPSGLLGLTSTIDISADGRYIVYASEASDLVSFDTNGVADVFLFDMGNGSTRLVSSKNSDFTAVGNGASTRPVISANGQVVAYVSSATDLSATTDTNGKPDVYARNLNILVTKLVTANTADNNGGNDFSCLNTPPSISDDGRFVAFDSQASDLVSNDTNGAGAFGTDVFVRDLQTNSTILASMNSAGTGSGNLDSFASGVRISGDGHFAAFGSNATDLVTGITDSNGNSDIFIRNLLTGSTSIVSVNPAGNAAGINLSQFPSISADGRFVAFTSRASNLVPVDTNNGLEGGGGIADVFVRDTQLNTTRLVSMNSTGTDSGNSSSSGPAEISADGKFVLFSGNPTNLTTVNDTNGNIDLFVRDLQTDSTRLITIDRFGNAAGVRSPEYSISGDGRVAAFESQSQLLVPNDSNNKTDVFASGPPSPGLTVSDVTVTEGDSGTTDAVFTITLTDGPPSGNVTATASTFVGSALFPNDFQFVLSELTFAPGETTKTVTVPVVGDVVFEGNETFTLELRDVTGAAVVDGVGLGTILENELQPTLSVNDISIIEGDSGTKDAIFTVSLSGPSSNTVSFGVGLTNGTAVEAEDFQGVGGGELISAGQTTRTISVPIIGDTISEASETFFLNLANPANATISDNQGIATIIDDESSSKPPTVQFSVQRPSVAESAGRVVIEVTRSGDLSAPATVEYATSAQSNASDRSDYTSAFGKLTYAAGESSKTFTVFITDDVFVEGLELFTITLSNPTGGASLGNPVIAFVQIIDNDTSPPTSNPADDATFFVRQHYVDFFNREPDPAGLAFWTNQITECQQPGATCNAEVRRINVSAAFFLSIEFQETGYLVERLYKVGYGSGNGISNFGGTHGISVPIVRLNGFLTDTQSIGRGVVVGQPGWEQALENNKVVFTQQFVQRGQFLTSMSPPAFVDLLFQNAGMTPTASERDAAINEFGSAINVIDVAACARAVRRVAENPTLVHQESNSAFVLMQYMGYLRRNPNDAPDSDYTGYDFWLTKLNQFNGNFVDAEMVKAFIVSGEYRHRFGP